MFDEVGDALLVVVFEDRTGFDHEPQFGLVRRLAVAAHVVPQTVRERTDEQECEADQVCVAQDQPQCFHASGPLLSVLDGQHGNLRRG